MPILYMHIPTAQQYRQAFEANLPNLSRQILDDCNFYCKEDTGALIASSEADSDLAHGHLVWDAQGSNGYVYAARQHYIIPTAYTTVNPNATWMWTHVAYNNHIAEWAQSAQRGMRRYL